MIVFEMPPQALHETGCFSVLSRCGHEELLFLPPGAGTDSAASESCWLHFLHPAADYSRLPVTPRTLVPEGCAAQFAQNPVFCTAQPPGGTLRARLEAAAARYGARLWLLCVPVCARLTLPCRDAKTQPLTPAALAASHSLDEAFFADAFCCNCLPAPEENAVYLYDTPQTLRQKCSLAEETGIGRVLLLPLQS